MRGVDSEGVPAVNEVESRTSMSSHDSNLFVGREEQDQVKPWTRSYPLSEHSSHLPLTASPWCFLRRVAWSVKTLPEKSNM